MDDCQLIINQTVQAQIEHITEVCARIKPLVAISCITYNHERYIAQALEGFVTQQTNFPFVALVHDDASTDKTAHIISEYAERYPNIILPICETENQYTKPDGSFSRIICNAQNATQAKYIALCEGDDYWTDPLKLQKQVDFLEAHPDYSICFHNAIEHFENSDMADRSFSLLDSREYTGTEIYANWIVPTASVVIRKQVYDSSIYKLASSNKNFIFGDIVLFLSAVSIGRAYAIADNMSVYRCHDGGVSHKISIDGDLRTIVHQKEIAKVFGSEYKRISHGLVSNLFLSVHYKYRNNGQILKALSCLIRALYYNPSIIRRLR